tara:strand:+ start:4350 stop:4652 length:303 start_codon:yes stop_codon:yes gene_type:complete
MLRRKYQQEKPDLIQDVVSKGKLTAILSIKLQGVSKIADHYIYEVRFLDNGIEKNIPIIAFDVTQALAKLEPHLNIGIPSATLKWMLGNERNVKGSNINL